MIPSSLERPGPSVSRLEAQQKLYRIGLRRIRVHAHAKIAFRASFSVACVANCLSWVPAVSHDVSGGNVRLPPGGLAGAGQPERRPGEASPHAGAIALPAAVVNRQRYFASVVGSGGTGSPGHCTTYSISGVIHSRHSLRVMLRV